MLNSTRGVDKLLLAGQRRISAVGRHPYYFVITADGPVAQALLPAMRDRAIYNRDRAFTIYLLRLNLNLHDPL